MEYSLYLNSIFDNLKSKLSKDGSPLVYDHEGQKINGIEILESIDSLALDLQKTGVTKGDRVIFLARPSIESMLYFFALSRTGAATVLVDPEMGQDNFNSRIDFAKPKFILQDQVIEKIEKFSFLKPVLRFFNIWFPDNLPFPKEKRITLKKLSDILEKKNKTEFKEVRIDESEDMLIIFTSGTVAKPKGVVHSYKSLSNALNIISTEISISKDDFLYASQFYFLLIGLMVSARTYIPKNKPFNPQTFLKISKKLSITSAFLLPYEGEMICKYCMDEKLSIPESFKTILFGSAPVTKGFLSRFSNISGANLRTYGVYGATEMLPIAMVGGREKIDYTGKGDLLGKPVRETEILISEEKEILASGPQLFVKYLGDGEDAKFFYSGDIGEIDANGNLILLGRKKDMIIRKGYNVYPTLFESSISKIKEVIECSMVGIYDDKIEDEKIVLFVVTDSKDKNFKNELKKLLTSGEYSIDSYALPDEIIFIDSMPRSGRSKKIDKSRLQVMARNIYA